MDKLIPERIEILGVPVDCVDMAMVLKIVSGYLDEGGGCHTIFAVNPEKVIRCETDEVLLSYLTKADILIPDGIGLVIASKMLSSSKMSRVAGADLMPEICELSLKDKNGIFMYGATKEVSNKAVEVLKDTYDSINIVGHEDGYVKQEDMSNLVGAINESEAEILFVALGSPLQEKWIFEHKSELKNVKVIQGVGGTFDALTGNVKRAPKIFRDVHLEWFYRLASQPKRIFRQTALPKFVIKVFRKKLFNTNTL